MQKSILFLLFIVSICFAQETPESYWHKNFNDQVIHGKTEVQNSGGVCDIVTAEYAIEVEPSKSWSNGLAQAKKYAQALNLKAALAVYCDCDKFPKKLRYKIDSTCSSQGVKLWIVNDFVDRPIPSAVKEKKATAQEEIVSFNTNSLKYHCQSCRAALRCTKSCINVSLSVALSRGGIPCQICGGSCNR